MRFGGRQVVGDQSLAGAQQDGDRAAAAAMPRLAACSVRAGSRRPWLGEGIRPSNRFRAMQATGGAS